MSKKQINPSNEKQTTGDVLKTAAELPELMLAQTKIIDTLVRQNDRVIQQLESLTDRVRALEVQLMEFKFKSFHSKDD